MAHGFSVTNTLNAWLNWLRGTAGSPPANLFVQLHTGDPGASGTANVAVGDNTRKAVTFAAASGGSIATTGTTGPWTNGGTSETITHISIWGASSSGTFYLSDDLAASKAWASGDTFTIPAGSTISITPAAA